MDLSPIMRTTSAPHDADHPLNTAFYEGIEAAEIRYEEAEKALEEAENKAEAASAAKTTAALTLYAMVRRDACTFQQLEEFKDDLELKKVLLRTALQELEIAQDELCQAIEAFTG
jgi:hypothetical protein